MSKIKFIHRRPIVSINRFDGTSTDYASHGGYTIAYRVIKDANAVEYSIARCSKKDNFNKKMGRMISTGRLMQGVNKKIVAGSESDFLLNMYTTFLE